MINRAQVRGDEAGEEIVMGSVVYMGRSSFRMETVFETVDENRLDDDGAPREVTGIVTSPYRTRGAVPANDATSSQGANDLLSQQIDDDATEIIARARAGQWRADEPNHPSLPDPLFGSQTDVPILSAPTERIFARRRRSVSLSRGALVAAGLLLFACGLASAAVARRATSSHAAAAHPHPKKAPKTAPSETIAAVPTEAAPTSVPVTPTSVAVAPTVIELPEPILVRAHKKTAALSTTGAGHASPTPARWVDPFAD